MSKFTEQMKAAILEKLEDVRSLCRDNMESMSPEDRKTILSAQRITYIYSSKCSEEARFHENYPPKGVDK